jgi:hypothetical protein
MSSEHIIQEEAEKYINNEQFNNARKLNSIIASLLTEIFANTLQYVIEDSNYSIPSFFATNTKNGNIDRESPFLKDVDKALTAFHQENRRFPNSLLELKLDITNLYAIWKNLIHDKDKHKHIKAFFKNAKEIRNECIHLTKMSLNVYLNNCDKLRKVIRSFPFVEEGPYLEICNNMLENLVFTDAQSTKEMIKELEKKFNNKLNSLKKRVVKNEKAIESQDKQLQSIHNEITNINQQITIIYNKCKYYV